MTEEFRGVIKGIHIAVLSIEKRLKSLEDRVEELEQMVYEAS